MPCMRCWIRGDSIASNDMLALMWREQIAERYTLIVLSWAYNPGEDGWLRGREDGTIRLVETVELDID